MSFILCIRTLTITKIMYLMIFCYFFYETGEEVYRFLYEIDLSRIYTTHSNCELCEGTNENANFNACQNCRRSIQCHCCSCSRFIETNPRTLLSDIHDILFRK